MDARSFVQVVLIDEVRAMQKAGVNLHLLAAISHGIEVCGAILDALPYKAKGQGRKRFNLALNELFSQQYQSANRQVDLYGQLRSHISHSFLPGKYVDIAIEPSNHHLIVNEGIVSLSLKQFCEDYIEAVNKLLSKIEAGELKNKRMELDVIKNML